MLSIKLHKSYRTVLAICDSDIIGKKFEQGQRQLDLRESSYKEKEISYEKALEILKFQAKEDATFNIVGKNAVKAAQEAGIITKEGIGKTAGIPYALVLL